MINVLYSFERGSELEYNVQSVGPRKTGNTLVEIICLREGLLALGVIHACKWPLKTPTNVFIFRVRGIFSANVVSELAAKTDSYTSGALQSFTFSGRFYTQSPTRLRTFCPDAFVLKVACDH